MFSSQEPQQPSTHDLHYYTDNLNAYREIFKKLYKGTKRSDLISQFALWQKGDLYIDEKTQAKNRQPADEIFKLWYNKYHKEAKDYQFFKTELQEFIQKENISLDINKLQIHHEKKLNDIKIELERLQKANDEIDKNYAAFCESREIYEIGGKLCSTIVGLPIGTYVLMGYAFIDACYTFYSTLKSLYIHDQINKQQNRHSQEINEFKILTKFTNGFFKCDKYQKLCDSETKPKLYFRSLDNALGI